MPASQSKQEEVAARRARVLQLRMAGMSYQDIARQTGHRTAAAAAQDATRALRDRQGLLDDQAALFTTLELERIDSLERATQGVMRTAAGQQDHETVLKAVDRLARLSERRSRLLGLEDGSRTPAAPPAASEPGKPGTVERRVRQDIAALVTTHPMGEALEEMSCMLARTLDNGAGLATAAVTRELRATLAELSRLAVDDSDELADELSAAVRDEKEP